MAGTALEVLRRRVGRSLGIMKSGTATGGGTDHVVDTALLSLFNDDFFKASGIVIVAAGGVTVAAGSTVTVIKVDSTAEMVAGAWVRIGVEHRQILSVDTGTQFTVTLPFSSAPSSGETVYGGWAPAGEKATIKTGNQATSKVTVFPNFTVAVASADEYEIYKGLSVDDVEDAINEAVRMAAAGFWEPVVDVSKTWTTGTLVLDLSALTAPIDPLYDVDYVGAQLLSSPATYPYADVTDQVVFFWDGTTPKIQFFQEMTSGAKIKISYRTRPTEMTSQEKTTGVTYANLDIYLRVQAVEQLAAAGFFGPESKDTDWRQERWGVQKAEVIFEKYRMPEPTGRVQTVAPHIPALVTARFTIRTGE